MSAQKAVLKNVLCGAICSEHGVITITFTTGSAIVDYNGSGLVRVGDVGNGSCGHTFQATTGSTTVDILGIGVHRVTDTGVSIAGANPGATYTITSSSSLVFSN